MSASSSHRRSCDRRVPRERGCRDRLRAPRRGEPAHDRRPRRELDPFRHHPRRARRRLHGRHLRCAHRHARRLPGHLGSRRDQPDARGRERPARLASARRARRAGEPRPRSTRNRTSSSTSCRCSVRSRSGATWSRCASPRRRWFARPSSRRTTEPPGATFIVLPEDVAERATDAPVLRVNTPVDPAPDEGQVHRAAHVLAEARCTRSCSQAPAWRATARPTR